MHRLLIRISFLAVASIFISACGDTDVESEVDANNDEQGMTAAEEACLHASEDTPIPRTAVVDTADADSGDHIGHSHRHYQIELVENDDHEFEGYLAYNVDNDARYGLFTSANVDVSFLHADGTELDVESTDSTECVEISQRHAVELEVGDYFVHFGPTSDQVIFTVSETLTESD